jgi:polyisoprenoid-binding protein YceI
MFNKFFLIVLSLTIAFFIVACGSEPAPSSSVTLATTVPNSAPTLADSATSTQSSSARNSDAAITLPQSLADVKEGDTFTFRVDPAQTSVEYAVDEVLFGNKQITRGSTKDVQGEFTLTVKDGTPIFSMSNLTVNLQSLASDNGLRDQAIQRQWLESAKYPTATFVATSVENVPADATAGKTYSFKVTGDMTIRKITKPVTFDVTVTLNGDSLTGEGITQIYMKDYGFTPPEILGRFAVSDPATITVKGVANLVEG